VTSLLDRRDANGRYVALEALAVVAAAPDIAAALRPHLPLISACLSDADPSVRKRTVDVLVTLCSAETVAQIVDQLLEHLAVRSASNHERLRQREHVLRTLESAVHHRHHKRRLHSYNPASRQRRCPLCTSRSRMGGHSWHGDAGRGRRDARRARRQGCGARGALPALARLVRRHARALDGRGR
jgi:Adaptin N terminal region